ncbi:MAG: hypothetical protein H7338_18890 [Candidatus Sericytochromatia bacterium]|nr:hypothetical protein [Candidatus Sericytochromatia bacterium]
MSRIFGLAQLGLASSVLTSLAACGPVPGTPAQAAPSTTARPRATADAGFGAKQIYQSSQSSQTGLGGQVSGYSSGYSSSGPGGYSYSWGGPINQGVQTNQQGQVIGQYSSGPGGYNYSWGGPTNQGQFTGSGYSYGYPSYGYGYDSLAGYGINHIVQTSQQGQFTGGTYGYPMSGYSSFGY